MRKYIVIRIREGNAANGTKNTAGTFAQPGEETPNPYFAILCIAKKYYVPRYVYADFVEKLRPKINDDGWMGFALRDGMVRQTLENYLSLCKIKFAPYIGVCRCERQASNSRRRCLYGTRKIRLPETPGPGRPRRFKIAVSF